MALTLLSGFGEVVLLLPSLLEYWITERTDNFLSLL